MEAFGLRYSRNQVDKPVKLYHSHLDIRSCFLETAATVISYLGIIAQHLHVLFWKFTKEELAPHLAKPVASRENSLTERVR